MQRRQVLEILKLGEPCTMCSYTFLENDADVSLFLSFTLDYLKLPAPIVGRHSTAPQQRSRVPFAAAMQPGQGANASPFDPSQPSANVPVSILHVRMSSASPLLPHTPPPPNVPLSVSS